VSRIDYLRRMASYNQWMNSRLYAACAGLPAESLAADRKAFFGSIIGTLNHLANADIIWLKRFATQPALGASLAEASALPPPASLGELRTADLAQLRQLRERLDAVILALADGLAEPDLDHVLAWKNSRGLTSHKNFFEVLMHFFNHQTHHRGQVTTLLSQEGVDVGATDLLLLVPEAKEPLASEVLRVAAFADGGQGGNPAGVWIGATLPSAAAMQRVAREIGFSETAFAAPDGDRWRVRYFSPETEVPFCGHATIALGASLARRFGDGVYPLALNQAAITVEGRATAGGATAALQSPPTRSRAAPGALVDAALALFGYTRADLDPRIPPALIHGGADHLVLALSSRDLLAAMRYELAAGRALMHEHGLVTIVLAWAEHPQLLHTRNPFASGGVYEDPATGAGTAALAGYLRDLDWPHGGQVDVVQGEDMGMRSLLRAQIGPEPGSSIRVSGLARFM
jgi:PhzF family phenazine biosynthesis protein